ncbi:THO complex subunit 1 [Chlorella sorokiniana]|uniref:THO complex subunit 1 n=1 Tax=Chlorella sorokiniana TaxID=3076 RepID=A0A2P6TG89_CHLSO|nr:THO complex subunit 1 [Chlorella sorokiniana]|eukprot:PRW33147.1 THO complex subunit 1 [Chlorella sorokiniana]
MGQNSYQEEVQRLQGLALAALQEHGAPALVAQALLRAAVPAAVAEEGGEFAGVHELSSGQSEQLTNALHAAAGRLLADAQAAGQLVMAYQPNPAHPPAVAQLLDAVLWLAEQRPAPVEAGLPAQLLEQITEGASNADCEGVFAWLDERTPTFKSATFENRSKLTLLRTCNMLLKRLSKSANAMLCGRVLLFLAKFLPLTERSGVNLMGAFNADNVTPVEEVQEGAVDSEGKLVDAAFYRTFWGLQSFFSNPPTALAPGKWGEVSRDIRRVLERFRQWGEVSRDIRRVLERFRQEKVTVGESAPGGSSAADGGGADGQGASVKYLSSSRLMGLQLRDATFRRHFLLQCLILMQWCERPRQKDKTGLRSKPLEDLQELRMKVYSELEATPDRGREFAGAIRHLMQWEDAWAAWKQSGCAPGPLERRPAEAPNGAIDADLTAPAPKRRKLGSDAIFGIRVGTDELDRLWNLTEDNLSALSAADRGGFKTVRQLMDPVIEEMQEAAAGEDDGMLIKASRSKLYSWKALRAVARTNLQAFSAAVQKGGDLEVAARAMYPSECPPPPAPPPAAPSAKAAAAGAGSGATPQPPASAGGPAETTAATKAGGEEAAGGAGDEAGTAAEAAGAASDGGAAEAASDSEEDAAAEEGELPEEGEAAAEEAGEADAAGLLEEAEEGEPPEEQAQQAEQAQQEEEAEEGEAPAAAADAAAAEGGGGDGVAPMES